MSGQYNGMQAKVSQLLGREVPYIPNQGHRSNTINEHACAASPIVSELFDTLQATYAFFSGSTKRQFVSSLRQAANLLEQNLPKCEVYRPQMNNYPVPSFPSPPEIGFKNFPIYEPRQQNCSFN